MLPQLLLLLLLLLPPLLLPLLPLLRASLAVPVPGVLAAAALLLLLIPQPQLTWTTARLPLRLRPFGAVLSASSAAQSRCCNRHRHCCGRGRRRHAPGPRKRPAAVDAS